MEALTVSNNVLSSALGEKAERKMVLDLLNKQLESNEAKVIEHEPDN